MPKVKSNQASLWQRAGFACWAEWVPKLLQIKDLMPKFTLVARAYRIGWLAGWAAAQKRAVENNN